MSTTSGRYDRVSIWLHWTIGLGIIAIAVVELLRGELFAKGSVPREALKALHDPAGTIIFALILLRVVWRVAHPVPALPPGMHAWERFAAKLTHVSLYLLIVVMPLLGFAATFARGRPVDFGLFQITSPLSVSVSRDVARSLEGGARLFGRGHSCDRVRSRACCFVAPLRSQGRCPDAHAAEPSCRSSSDCQSAQPRCARLNLALPRKRYD